MKLSDLIYNLDTLYRKVGEVEVTTVKPGLSKLWVYYINDNAVDEVFYTNETKRSFTRS